MKTLLLLFCLTFSAQAQLTLRSAHYPTLFKGAAVSSFSPSSLTNLYLWYNASAATNVAGTGAEYLVDQSGNGRHMIQPTSGNRPTFNTNNVGGLHSWTWDGSDDWMSNSVSPGDSVGVFILVQPTTADAMTGFIDTGPFQSGTFRMNGGLSVEIHNGAPSITQTSFGAAETLVYDYRVMVTGGRALDSTKNLGTPVTGTNTSTASVAWTFPTLGNVNRGGTHWSGKVVQIIITAPYGSGTDRTNVVNYLKALPTPSL